MVCLLCVNMHIYIKDVYTEYFPTHQSERNNLLSTSLHIYLTTCTLGVSLHICLKDVYSQSFPEHLF